MALIDCPACNKKISDKSKTCAHCGFALGSASKEDIERKESLARFQKHQSLQAQSIFAVILFVAGFAIMYWGDDSALNYQCQFQVEVRDGGAPLCLWHGQLQYNIAILCSFVGFVWYIVNRIRILMLKKFR